MRLGRIILDIFDVFGKARTIREDGERRKKSSSFAVTAIAYSLVMLFCAAGGAYLMTAADSGLLYIFLLVIGLVLLVGAVIQFIAAFLRVIVQFTLNRRAISWVALAVFIISLIAAVISVIHIFGT